MEVLLRSGALVRSEQQEGELYQSPGDDFAILILAVRGAFARGLGQARRMVTATHRIRRTCGVPLCWRSWRRTCFACRAPPWKSPVRLRHRLLPRALVLPWPLTWPARGTGSLLHGSEPTARALPPRLARSLSASDGRAAANGGLTDCDVTSMLSLPTPRDLLFTWSGTSTPAGRGAVAPGEVRAGVAIGSSSVTAPGSRAARAARNQLVSRGVRDVRGTAGQPVPQETPLRLFGEVFVQCTDDPAVWRARFAILKVRRALPHCPPGPELGTLNPCTHARLRRTTSS